MGNRNPRGESTDAIRFASFCLDPRAGRLTRDGEPVPLRPKTWDVLLYLAQRPEALVTKDELLDAIWPDVAVTPDTLTKSIGELRLALGDDSKRPRYIETVHRRGFRFIAPAGNQEPAIRDRASVIGDPWSPPAASLITDHRSLLAGPFVGRAVELQRLERLLAYAHTGRRQNVFVTGPPGIGKTALVEAFLDSSAVRAGAWVGRGACVEQHGAREAHMPVLEALERLARRSDAERLTTLLRRAAPTWLVQMPWMMSDDAEAVRRLLPSVRPERMLREFGALIEAFTGDVTVVLVLEDLHWCDPSTVELLSFLAQRREPARLLVIGTYRPADAAVREHPLSTAAHTLKARRQCIELPVHELTQEDVQSYLERRFPDSSFPPALAPLLHDHTDGNPLFMVSVVEHMLSRGLILDTAPGWALSMDLERMDLGVPDDVGQMVEAQIEMLNPADRELVEVASVGGIEVAVPAIAGAMRWDVAEVEVRCENLARARRFLRAGGPIEWPDGSVTRRYAFTHELYRRVLYAQIPDRQRQQTHLRLAETLEATYGDRAGDVAPVLAVHFERGRDPLRAIRYLILAGARARQRFANREALGYFESALAAVTQLSGQDLRQRQELDVRLALGPVLSDRDGYASEGVRANYERADSLCTRVGSSAKEFEIIYALCHYHTARGNIAADDVAARLDALADTVGTAAARLQADSALVRIALIAGRFAEAQERMRGFLGLGPARDGEEQPEFGPDPAIAANSHYALALWFLGHHERARATARASIEAARASGTSFTQAAALSLGGILEVFGRNAAAALALAEEAASVSKEQGFAYWHAIASAVLGQAWVLHGRTREGVEQLARARSALQATGTLLFSTHLLAFLAGAHWRDRRLDEALAAANEGLVLAESSLDRTYRPELWRLKGELLLAAAPAPRRRGKRIDESPASASESQRQEGERCLLHALELARESAAKSLELRAATSVARAWQGTNRAAEARKMLAAVCAWFDSAAHGADIDDARALLHDLRGSDQARSKATPGKVRPSRRTTSASLSKTLRL